MRSTEEVNRLWIEQLRIAKNVEIECQVGVNVERDQFVMGDESQDGGNEGSPEHSLEFRRTGPPRNPTGRIVVLVGSIDQIELIEEGLQFDGAARERSAVARKA